MVRLIGVGGRLLERVMRSLPPGAALEVAPSLVAVDRDDRLAMLNLYVSSGIDLAERQRIECFLRERPRRLVVLCDWARTEQLFRLAVRCHPLGLVAVEESPPEGELRRAVLRWYLSGFITPDLAALKLPEGDVPAHVGRLLRFIEREPFRPWQVVELAKVYVTSTDFLGGNQIVVYLVRP